MSKKQEAAAEQKTGDADASFETPASPAPQDEEGKSGDSDPDGEDGEAEEATAKPSAGKKAKAAQAPFPGFAGETPAQADKRLAKESAAPDHRSAAPDSKNPPKGFIRVRMKAAIAGVNFSYKAKDEPWLHPEEAKRWEQSGLCDILPEDK